MEKIRGKFGVMLRRVSEENPKGNRRRFSREESLEGFLKELMGELLEKKKTWKNY